MGEMQVAAHQLALSVFMLFSLLGEAPSIAGQVLVARYVAVGNRAEARKVIGRLVRVSAKFGLLARYTVCLCLPSFVFPLFGLWKSQWELSDKCFRVFHLSF